MASYQKWYLVFPRTVKLGPIKDVEGNQIGDADYVYTREEALLEIFREKV